MAVPSHRRKQKKAAIARRKQSDQAAGAEASDDSVLEDEEKKNQSSRTTKKEESSEEEESSTDESSSDSEEEETDDDDAALSSDDGFEEQGSSSEEDEDDLREKQHQADDDSDSDDDDDMALQYESTPRTWSAERSNDPATARWVHTDDLSSDDEAEGDEVKNRIGRVPLHWYDDQEHIGYDVHGAKVARANGDAGGDRLDQALAQAERNKDGKFVVYDALHDRQVELTPRQVELIRRLQQGAYAHPEHDGNAEYIDYFSGVDKAVSGLNSDQYEPKARFQPSRFEAEQVQQLLDKLARGKINMDYLTGKVRDMNDVKKNKEQDKGLFLLWKGDEEDLLNQRKGPQHISAPKLPPPGHAESYRPPEEYLPKGEEKEKNESKSEQEEDEPSKKFVPKQFPNLRSVGAYQNSVRERFERCLDLYLCPRVLKRRLNIDPESLVPQLPKVADLRPFPTALCMEYTTPGSSDDVMIRSVTVSPDGQFLASGASDGFVRLWEVETGRLLRSWDLATLVRDSIANKSPDSSEEVANSIFPVVCVEWNPNRSHHVLLAAAANCVVVLATGTAGREDAEITQALLSIASRGGGHSSTEKAKKAVEWITMQPSNQNKKASSKRPISAAADDALVGPVCCLKTSRGEVASVRWQAKGDYFCSVNPKAGAAAVLIHQLTKGHSQQPFQKAKGEAQLACFHPNKPFLFVASQQHVRVYHLIKQTMVRRLVTGCRWISSLDVHSSGDHLIVGSLDRRMIWFDLDLGTTPYKTLKYHERALRSSRFHGRYPLMASASDDGAVHVFHSRVYGDLMRNPLIVPVKILRGHSITNKLGVLTLAFHPTQPWLFTGGADGKILLFQDI